MVAVETLKDKGIRLKNGDRAPRQTEWPARLDKKVTIENEDGTLKEISFDEYLVRINNNNRGGT